MFKKPGEYARTSIKKIQQIQEEEQKQSDLAVDDDDMAAFENIKRASEKRFVGFGD